MTSVENDLIIAEGMATDLKTYLLSNTLYWSITSGGVFGRSLYRVTLGSMLMRLHQLEALGETLDPAQRTRLATARQHARATMEAWIVQAERKALREIKARVRQWSIYITELEEAAEAFMDEYPMQARARTALAFALDAAGRSIHGSSLFTRLIVADRKCAKVVRESPFILDAHLEAAYPNRPYWWLYAAPIPPEEQELRFG